MSTFKALLEKELRGKIRKNSQDAQLLAAVKQKRLGLQGTISARADEYIPDAAVGSIEEAADALIDQWIDDLLDGDLNDSSKSSKAKIPKIRGIQTKRGQFISALNLKRLLQLTLYNHVKNKMDSSSETLNWQTGRLAHSARVTSMEEDSGDDISLYFSYMLYPYETFEEWGSHKVTKPPSELIDSAIDEALRQMLMPRSYERFTIHFDRGD